MSDTNKRSSEALSPLETEKNCKIMKQNTPSGLGLISPMKAMATNLPTPLEVEPTITELKKEFGKELPKNSDLIVRFMVRKFNTHINGCSTNLDYLYDLCSTLDKQHEELRSLMKGMNLEISQLSSENQMLKTKLNDQENYTRRNNLIFKQIPEVRGQNVELLIRDLLADKFGMQDVRIERLHRLGQYRQFKKYPRPIIVRFSYYPDREFI